MSGTLYVIPENVSVDVRSPTFTFDFQIEGHRTMTANWPVQVSDIGRLAEFFRKVDGQPKAVMRFDENGKPVITFT